MPGRKKALSSYRAKRDFRRTPEPEEAGKKSREPTRFVIQKHDATSPHYDFRLEVDGVLKSWAIPKGPSTDPRQKRLAVATEDHPLEYADFEGVIPEDEYGGGTVMVWDHGTYRLVHESDHESDRGSTEKAVHDGHLAVWLEGRKLQGGYALTRMNRSTKRWVLVKMDDSEADARRRPTSTQNWSARTGRTMAEIRNGRED